MRRICLPSLVGSISSKPSPVNLEPSAFKAIKLAVATGIVPMPVLPGLRSVEYTDGEACTPTELIYFLCPIVADMHLDISEKSVEGRDGQRKLLDELTRACAGIVRLSIRCNTTNAHKEFRSGLQDLLHSLKQLESINFAHAAFSHEVIRSIGNQRFLKHLVADLRACDDDDDRREYDMVQLTSCKLSSYWFDPIVSFAERIRTSPLEVFSAEFEDTPAVDTSLRPLLRLLQRFQDTLTEIVLEWEWDAGGEQTPEHGGNYISGSTIDVLYACSKLRVLRINVLAYFSGIDDSVLEDIAAAWHLLEVLDLGGTGLVHWPSPVTTNGIAAIANGCRQLKELSVGFDAPHEFDVSLICHVENANTQVLSVGCSVVANEDLVTTILSSVFPNLQEIRWSSNRGLEDNLGDLLTTERPDVVYECHSQWDKVISGIRRRKSQRIQSQQGWELGPREDAA